MHLNALKHGFFASDVVNPVLDGPTRVEEFNAILDALLRKVPAQIRPRADPRRRSRRMLLAHPPTTAL